eukprot:c45396_g1_i1 orf=83-238(+)
MGLSLFKIFRYQVSAADDRKRKQYGLEGVYCQTIFNMYKRDTVIGLWSDLK